MMCHPQSRSSEQQSNLTGWGWQDGSLNPTLQYMVSTSRDCVPSHIGGECELDPEVRGHQYDLWILCHSPVLDNSATSQ